MKKEIIKFLDYLKAATRRASARNFAREADALGALHQAVGRLLASPAEGEHVRGALEALAGVNPRRARALRPAIDRLLSRHEGSGA